MKLMHLSDLHLGKRLNEFSLLEDQRHILREILRIADAERPDAVILAGDLYDKSVPSAEAVALLDWFLTALAGRKLPVLLISGNHDSPERLAFASELLAESGVYVSPVFDGEVRRVELRDEFGPVHVYLLPFLKPAAVRPFYPDADIPDYTAACRAVLGGLALDPAARNVLVAHAFVTGAERSASEEVSVGGADNVDASVFAPFDYVALGHLHGPQNVADGRIRYCGSPLKYSFSEAAQEKSVTVVELGPKGESAAKGESRMGEEPGEGEASGRKAELRLRTVPLTPKRDLKELRGTYMQFTARSFYEGLDREDYLRITLTDEEDVPDAVSRLRVIYPNLMKLDYDNRRTRSLGLGGAAANPERKTPLQLFAELYEKQNGAALSPEQAAFCEALMESIREEGT